MTEPKTQDLERPRMEEQEPGGTHHEDDEKTRIEGERRGKTYLAACMVVLRVDDLVDQVRRSAETEEEASESTPARSAGDDERERRRQTTLAEDERNERSARWRASHRLARP